MTTYSNTIIACTPTLTHLRATLDKGPRTNLEQIEHWIGPFSHLKFHFFLRYNECV
jgi:hypothetical protein